MFFFSCKKEVDKPTITITPTLSVDNGKWIMTLKYSDTINTQGFVRFYWTVKDTEGRSYKWFGAIPLEEPQIKQVYNSHIDAFQPFTLDKIEIIPDDYLKKYTILVSE